MPEPLIGCALLPRPEFLLVASGLLLAGTSCSAEKAGPSQPPSSAGQAGSGGSVANGATAANAVAGRSSSSEGGSPGVDAGHGDGGDHPLDAGTGGEEPGGGGERAVAPYFPGWADPAADAKVLVEGSDSQQEIAVGLSSYSCAQRTYDVTRQFDRVLGLSTQFVDVKAGAILEGKPLQGGQFVIVPGPRSPLTISIDLPISEPTRYIEHPSSATIQAAVASLQLQADSELTSDQLRSNFTHTVQNVASFEDAAFYFGVDLKYSGPLATAGLSTSFATQHTAGDQSWAVKHIEEMYTITFADDEFTTFEDFFADGLGTAQVAKLSDQGLIGPDNPPVFVKSVTFGRLVMATSVAHQQYNTKDFQLTLEGGGYGFSGNANIVDAYKNLAKNSAFQLLVLGGTANEAASALHAAKIEDMFGPAQAKTAQPLYYSVRFAQGERRTAKVGSTTTYTEETCGPCVTCLEGWTFDTDCKLAQHDAGLSTVWDDGGLHASGGFVVPSGDGISAARICIDAGYNTGGIYDNGDHAFDVYCGTYRAGVARNEITGNNYPHHKQWCWDNLTPGTACGADNLGTGWTPFAQGLGKVDVKFTVDYYSGSPSCAP